jgi:hypothetical protein
MATRTIANGGGNWTTNGTWVEGTAPTAADDVVATGTSGNVTIDSGAVCRSVNLTNYVGTLTHTAAVTLTVGDATAGASNVAILFVAGMTLTVGASTSLISLVSSSATQQTVTTGGKGMPTVAFDGVGGNYILSDNWTSASTTNGFLSSSAGKSSTLSTNGKNYYSSRDDFCRWCKC